jgi:hypothetical protein
LVRLFDLIGALVAGTLALVSLLLSLTLFGEIPISIALRGLSGYAAVAALLTIAAMQLWFVFRTSFSIVGSSFEMDVLKNGLAFRRLVGYSLLVLGGGLLHLLRTAVS